ncbi:MAG: hypothetical protein RI884_3048 [Pseudomonadota bacterium]|jgi:hypothetical protein
MSEIVLGVGTSHSPLLAIEPTLWLERARDDVKRTAMPLSDGRVVSYDELAQLNANRHAGDATLERFEVQASVANAALERIASDIELAQPDLVIIIGDDQDELFSLEHMPALAIYYGDDIVMHPPAQARPSLPDWYRHSLKDFSQDAAHVHLGAPQYAMHLIEGLLDRGVDVAASSGVSNPVQAGFGHAFGFVIQRLMKGRRIPVLPVMLNTYFQPNVMRPWRCHEVGRMLREIIETSADNLRVAIVASGGLSHFVCEESFDRAVLEALRQGDAQTLRAMPAHAFKSGTSEVLNWVMAAGALEGLQQAWAQYVPVYRTPAGTGVGLAFTSWKPRN